MKYIVIVTQGPDREGYFKRILYPSARVIREYVKSMGFGDSVRMRFYDVSELKESDYLQDDYETDNVVKMDSSKALDDFLNEVDELIEKLEIKEEPTEE